MKRILKQLPVLFFIFTCFVAGAQTSVPSYMPTAGLVGWWPFSGNANDRSGNGNNGIATNAILTADRFGNSNFAYSFNGLNSRIDVPDAVSLRCRKITMSAWFYNKNIAKTTQLIYKGSLNADGEAYSMYCQDSIANSGAKVGGNCVSGIDWRIAFGKQRIVQGAWEHMVATYDGAIYKVYKNGALDTSYAITGLIDSCIGGGLRFGYNHNRYIQFTGDCFDGYIDDIAIWNRALTESEVTQLYTGTENCGYGNMGINVCVPQRNLHIKDVMRIEPRDTPPSNPGRGDIYYDGILNKLRVFDGTIWQNCW